MLIRELASDPIVDHLLGRLTTDASILTFSFPGGLGMFNKSHGHGGRAGQREVHFQSILFLEL